MIEKIYVCENAMNNISNEVKKKDGFETGGVLIGYIGDTYGVVTHCSGPGPKSKQTRTSVTIDGNYTTKFSTDTSKRSNGRLYYLGDWHIHLENYLYPSGTDINAMEVLLREKVSPWESLFSLILYKELDSYRIFEFKLGLKFRELPIVTCGDPYFINEFK